MKGKAIELLKKYTKHNFIELTDRGNTAIFAALYCTRKLSSDKKMVLIPDQGGWFSYLKHPKMLEMKPVKVKTDYGIIDLDDLKEKVKDANCLIYPNPAGYFAEQPIKEVYDICKGRCFAIMDVAGCIGDEEMCNGDYADFIVGSFGMWKPVNLYYGGFISAREEEFFQKPKEIFSTIEFDESFSEKLYEKLKNVKDRLDFFYNEAKKIKNDLKDFEVLHKDKRGINVVVKFNSNEEKEKIINYCDKHKYEYTICPRYLRVDENAISIEIKRMAV